MIAANLMNAAVHAATHAAITPGPITIWGTIPTWITAACSAGGLGAILTAVNAWRKGTIDKIKVEDEGDAGIRTHYATELASLRAQIAAMAVSYADGLKAANDRYTAGMEAADKREDHCQRQVASLRDQVDKLRDEVDGFRRNSLQVASSILTLPPVAAAFEDSAAASIRALDQFDAQHERTPDAD